MILVVWYKSSEPAPPSPHLPLHPLIRSPGPSPLPETPTGWHLRADPPPHPRVPHLTRRTGAARPGPGASEALRPRACSTRRSWLFSGRASLSVGQPKGACTPGDAVGQALSHSNLVTRRWAGSSVFERVFTRWQALQRRCELTDKRLFHVALHGQALHSREGASTWLAAVRHLCHFCNSRAGPSLTGEACDGPVRSLARSFPRRLQWQARHSLADA